MNAKAISDQLKRDGFLRCTPAKVCTVLNGKSLPDDPALESAILQAIE